MSSFNLKILTPKKTVIDREIEKVIVRTTEGDVGILKNHVNYLAAVKDGPLTVFFIDGTKQKIIIKDGFISVIDGKVVIMTLYGIS